MPVPLPYSRFLFAPRPRAHISFSGDIRKHVGVPVPRVSVCERVCAPEPHTPPCRRSEISIMGDTDKNAECARATANSCTHGIYRIYMYTCIPDTHLTWRTGLPCACAYGFVSSPLFCDEYITKPMSDSQRLAACEKSADRER